MQYDASKIRLFQVILYKFWKIGLFEIIPKHFPKPDAKNNKSKLYQSKSPYQVLNFDISDQYELRTQCPEQEFTAWPNTHLHSASDGSREVGFPS